eukprot:scaffold10881_cov35-Tisochrysis_lutea.AAC.2
MTRWPDNIAMRNSYSRVSAAPCTYTCSRHVSSWSSHRVSSSQPGTYDSLYAHGARYVTPGGTASQRIEELT